MTSSSSSFTQIPFAPTLLRAITEMGYEHMTPIQAQAIPVVLAGQDVMGAAQTGTGKTAAFSLPLLQRLIPHENSSTSPARHPVRALVLLPTRELADQVAQQISQYAQHTKLASAVVFGGIDIRPQAAQLKKGVEILVATPGRLLDHIEAKNVVLNQVEYVVLDEADRMLDIGFLPDLERILSYLPKERTTLLFSATFSPEIKRLAGSYLQNPTTIEVARPNETAATVEQRFYGASDESQKRQIISAVLEERGIKQAFIFCNSKLGCARLTRALERDGYRCAALHGNKNQDERLKALEAFKQSDVDLLVCTDVAARGLDIKDLPVVFNYDVPFNPEDYVHRIGRTGRAGASGLAVTIVGTSDTRAVQEISKLIKTEIKVLSASELAYFEMRSVRESRDSREGRDSRISRGSRQGRRSGLSFPAALPSVPLDPFFSRPYEAAVQSSSSAAGTSSSHKQQDKQEKRKIAALLMPAPV